MDWFGKHLSHFWRARGGIASVELAMCLPLIVLMLFGTIEIGRMYFEYHAASKSVRDATRYLTRVDAGLLGLVCPAGTIDNTTAEVIKAKNLALRGTIDTSRPYLLAYWTALSSVSVTASCIEKSTTTLQGLFVTATWIRSITVSATVPMPLMNGWLLGLGDTLTFTISHKEVHFGQ